jgi:hypothetical protein
MLGKGQCKICDQKIMTRNQDVDNWMEIPIQHDYTFELIIPFQVI